METTYLFHRGILAAFALLFMFVLAGGRAAMAAMAASPPDLKVTAAQARITQDVIICPGSSPSIVSCFLAPAPTDSYDIDADLRLPRSSDFFDDIANNSVNVTFAPATCSAIAVNGLPANAFSLTIPSLQVDRGDSLTRAHFRGTIPVNPPGSFFPQAGTYLSHLAIEIVAAGERPRRADLHLDGNANLCTTAPLAVQLNFSDSSASPDTDQDSVCIDLPSPAVDTLDVSSRVLHACVIHVGP